MTGPPQPTVRAVCRQGNCVALPRAGQEYCAVHTKAAERAEADARRRLDGRRRPVRPPKSERPVSEWLPLDLGEDTRRLPEGDVQRKNGWT